MLRGWRERALLTQEQLADRAGLSVRTVRRLERGIQVRPRGASLQLLADALGLSAAEREALVTATSDALPRRTVTEVPVPRQLPANVAVFIGREQELADLENVHSHQQHGADPDSGHGPPVKIIAVDGMAGIGKTTFAIHAAHRLTPHFPDGTLFVDLYGYTQGRAPVDAGDALDQLLRGLGLAGERIPPELDERSALYRSVLADRRALIVLDNAVSERQVRPLLPGAGGCMVVITSRGRLTGLERTHTVSLDIPSSADALAMFVHAAGHNRLVRTPTDLLHRTVQRCAMLPLAIYIAGARLRSHPSWNVEDLLERMDEHEPRLDELQAGERSLTAALDLSYRELTPGQQRAYRLMGTHPGKDFDVHAAAALLGSPVPAARRLLDQLLDVHLLQEPVAGRYRFHDLVREHAAVAAGHDGVESGAATGRLLDHYGTAVTAAVDTLYPYEADKRPAVRAVRAARVAAPAMRSAAQASTWLDAELANLVAVAAHAADHGFGDRAVQLSAALHRCLRTRGRYIEAEAILHRALTAARVTGNRSGEIEALLGLGEISSARGLHGQAAAHLGQALDIAQETSDRRGELGALNGLGWTHRRRGRYQQAAEVFERALGIAHAIGNRTGELDSLTGLGDVHRMLGRHERSADDFAQALDIARALGHRTGELKSLSGLGHVLRALGRLEEAADNFARALPIARATGHRTGELDTLSSLGDIHRLRGRLPAAASTYQQVLDIATEIGSPNWQFEAVQGLGRLWRAAGRPAESLDHHQRALALATDLNQPDDEARAHDGVAHACHTLGRYEEARRHWRQALEILTTLGNQQTEDEEANVDTIRAHLTALEHSGGDALAAVTDHRH
ncbi:ATP-binding protein [Nonomuraea sp. KM90]|uniref:ATP-binding protein n=1 Tax=Nonomuraea sp. KM90 TaxID=3457428 RepID=UPI003FCDBC27